MKETILRIPALNNPGEVREFLETAGHCRLWIPGYAKLAKPLYEVTIYEVHQCVFDDLKTALLRTKGSGLVMTRSCKTFHSLCG